MKKVLLVGGCSFTANNFETLVHPEMDTSWQMWPQLLAKKLDMQLVNVAISGAGNEQIFSSILDTLQHHIDPKRVGLVLAAWTQCQRGSWQESKYGYWKNNRVFADGDVFCWVKRAMRYWHMFQLLCESHNLPYKQFQMLPIFESWLNGLFKNDWEIAMNKGKPDFVERYKYPGDYDRDKKMLEQMVFNYERHINTKNWILWPPLNKNGCIEHKVLRDENFKYKPGLIVSRYDTHPSEFGQKKIAKFIYERLG